MKLAIFAVFVLVVMLTPGALAVGGCGGDFYPICADNETLRCELNMLSGSDQINNHYNITCPMGCVNSTFEGTSFCRVPPKPITSSYHLLFEIVAIGMLLFSMIRRKEEKQGRAEYTYQHGIISLVAMILFFALALLSTEMIVVYINWMFACVATIWTIYLYAMSMYPDDKAANRNPLGV